MNNTTQNWEERFEDKFVAHITSKPGNIEHDRAVIFFEDTVKIKDFIKSELTTLIQEIAERKKVRIEQHRTSNIQYGVQSVSFEDIIEVAKRRGIEI